ncbi:MAG: hypothetical protein GY757_62270 [bacterium]|nr:hypothetical protein [bacterium]
MNEKNNQYTQVGTTIRNIKERDYWLDRLSGNPLKTFFPYDNRTPEINKREIKENTLRISAQQFAKLEKLSKQSEHRLHIALVTVLVLMLNKYTGSRDIIVGIPVYKQDVEGELVNTALAIRNRITDEMSIKEILLQTAQAVFEANENQNYPIETLLYKLDIPLTGNEFPLFDTVVLLENIHEKQYMEDIATNITFRYVKTAENLDLTVEYNTVRYEEISVKRLIHHMQYLMTQLFDKLDAPIRELEILPEEEKQQLLYRFNETETPYPEEKLIHQLFEEQELRTPQNIALTFIGETGNETRLSYAQLNEKANCSTKHVFSQA